MAETVETARPVKRSIRRFAGGRLHVGTVVGFPIYLHWTLLLLLVPFLLGGWSSVGLILRFVGIIVPIVVIHELAHAIAARLFGFGTGSITVFILGGYFIPYQISRPPFEMSRAMRLRYIGMVLAGPMSNLALASLFYLINALMPAQIIHTLALINLELGLLNLLPLPPLDGSQVVINFASLYVNRLTIYMVFLLLLSASLISIFVFPDFFFQLPRSFNPAIGILPAGIVWIIRLMIKSDKELISEWRKEMHQERLIAEGEYAWADQDI